MKIRLKFSKIGAIKFIGHLDLMRTFQKIFRQAGIPIAYSEGFNPHQIFSIAAPLSVGVTSNGEYLDLKLVQDMDTNVIIERINKSCPNGLSVDEAIVISEQEPSAMGSVTAAKYTITQDECIITNEMVEKLSKLESLIIKKKNKKGKINDLDIKPGIYSVYVDGHKILMTLATGSTLNVKPEAVLMAFSEETNIAYNRFNYKVHREELYHGETNLIPLTSPIMPVE